MLYINFSDQLCFLITACFSFFIFIASVWFKDSASFPRYFGISFIISFLLSSFSFLVQRKSVALTLSDFVIPSILLSLLILHQLKLTKRHFSLVLFCCFSVSSITIWAVIKYPVVQNLSNIPLNIFIVIVLLLTINLFFLKKEEGLKSFLFWAILPLSAASAINYYMDDSFFRYLIPFSKAIAFTLFVIYFHYSFYKNLARKNEEAESKIIRVNRTLDLEVKKRIIEIERVNQNLVNISKIDSLSKALNKRAILDSIEKLINNKAKNEFSILMFDIDNFKTINDTLGHIAGDKCIKSIATIAKVNLRDFDMIGRYGGDEFIIVLPSANLQQAMLIAERFRRKVELTEEPHFTVSIGISSYPKDGSSVKELIEVADKALYKSKDKGKNVISFRELS